MAGEMKGRNNMTEAAGSKKLLASIVVSISTLFSANVLALEDVKPTAVEIARLPFYCRIKFTYGEDIHNPAVKPAVDLLGTDYVHVHHYCLGINFMSRAERASNTRQDRAYNLQAAAGNLRYMLTHSSSTLSIRHEVHWRLGMVEQSSKSIGGAILNFQKAIGIKPDYVPAYGALADVYQTSGDTKKALATVTEGLRHIPASKSLQRRYDELGGKKPYPEPYAAPEEKPEAAEAPAKAADDPLAPKAIRAKREDDAQAPATSSPATTPSPAAIGTRRNPWCRYCAEEDAPPPNPQPPSTSPTAPTTAP